MEQVAAGVWRWRERSERLGYDLNGTYWSGPDGAVAVDPPPLSDAARERMETEGRPALIVVTNRTHWRATPELSLWSGAEIAMSAVDAAAVEGPVGRILGEGDELPGGWRVLELPGKTLGEIALHRADEGGGVLIVGDALIGDPPGRLRLLPAEKLDDRALLVASLARLDALRFSKLIVGDGESILADADLRVREFLLQLT